MENIKNFLQNNILDKNGKISQAKFIILTEDQKIEIFKKTEKCKTNKLTERIWWILNSIEDYPKVCRHPNCNNPVRFRGEKYVGEYCSYSCNSKHQLILNPNPFSGKNGVKIRKNGMLKKYGVEHNMKLKECLTARKETYTKNYGVDHPMKDSKIKNKTRKSHEERGNWMPIENLDDYESYKRSVLKFTNKQNINKLKYYELRGKSKTSYHLDHKFSMHSGFKNNIPAHIIGNIVNLEFIPLTENVVKRNKCSITKEELFEMFYFD